MLSITSLVNKLSVDFPDYTLIEGDTFRWDPDEQVIYYLKTSGDTSSLLHEVAHAALKHTDYTRDIQLIEIERDAWEYAQTQLAHTYGVVITNDEVQDALDTYRDWLHARSSCPKCKATGIQSKKHFYQCLACNKTWRVNDARFCALRRYSELTK